MASKPDISIIMAVKNTEPYLRQCLNSVLAQTFQNWELIAINDHSTDRSREILDTYAAKDNRIKVVDSEGERLIPALKTGIKCANGTLINRMDSDDRMPEYKLQLMFDHWLKHGKGSIVAGGTQHFVEDGTVGDGFLRYDAWLNEVAKHGSHYDEIYRECVFPSHCWLLHRDDFERVGGFDLCVYPEDYDLSFRFYRHQLKVVPVDKVLHYWRDRSERISRTWDEYKDNRYFDLKLRYFYELDRNFDRPLVLWGAGKNGKDLCKLLMKKEQALHWVCDNDQKIGKDIYGVIMQHFSTISDLVNPQIMVVVSSPDAREEIKSQLDQMSKQAGKDYWLFL